MLYLLTDCFLLDTTDFTYERVTNGWKWHSSTELFKLQPTNPGVQYLMIWNNMKAATLWVSRLEIGGRTIIKTSGRKQKMSTFILAYAPKCK